jgi:hypothetical protein
MRSAALLSVLVLVLACTGEPHTIGTAPGLGAGCDTDTDCGGLTPICADGACVSCRRESDCDDARLCSERGLCVACVADSDCGDAARCVGNRCVAECDAASPCDEEDAPMCDALSGVCVDCVRDEDCEEDSPFCDPERLACTECRSNADCDAEHPRCVLGQCARCIQNTDCPSGEVCTDDLECEATCTTAEDCSDASKPVCDTTQHVCVECLDDSACTRSPEKPVCIEQRCMECRTAADCPPEERVCTDDNECASS